MGALAIGVFIGVVIEYFIDVRLMDELQRENKILRDRYTELKQKQKVETIEIIDKRASNPDNLFQPF